MLLGEHIKYHRDFFNNTFTERFDVVSNDAYTRQGFMNALETARQVSEELEITY